MDGKDTIEIETPNKHKVVIRNYTTRGDDKAAGGLLSGATVTTGPQGEPQVSISLEATEASEAKYVELLVQSIDGEGDNIPKRLDDLRSEDYATVQTEMQRITATPKAPSTPTK